MTATRPEVHGFISSLDKLNDFVTQSTLLNQDTSPLAFFRRQSSLEQIIGSATGLIEKFKYSMTYPAASYQEKVFFLEELEKMYSETKKKIGIKLKDYKPSNRELWNFSHQLFDLIKGMVFSLWPNDFLKKEAVNLNYLDYYLDALSFGLDPPSNLNILKQEALTILASYINTYPNSNFLPQVNAIYDSIFHDKNGINQHTTDSEKQFYHILKLLNMFRLTLIDQRENTLSSAITQVIDHALEIIRPNQITTFKQIETVINNRLEQFEKTIYPQHTRLHLSH